MTTNTQRILKLAMIGASVIALSGCATYANLEYDSALSKTEAKAAKTDKADEVTAQIATDFGADVRALHARGYTLIGHAKFKSPLVPMMAKWNAKSIAKGKGASHVLLAKPQPAGMGQFHHLFTYWRDQPLPGAGGPLFGGYYSDANANALGALGCDVNTVTLDIVAPGTPAAKAGLKAGDVIASVNGQAVYGAGDVDRLLWASAGQSVPVNYLRGNASHIATVALGDVPRLDVDDTLKPHANLFGGRVVDIKLPKDKRKAAGQKTGLFVSGVDYGGFACASRLRYGDVILKADGKRVKSESDLLKRFDKARGRTMEIEYMRGADRRTETIDLGADIAERVQGARRYRIAESDLSQPPWSYDKGGDYTWLVITMAAAQGALEGYTRSIEAERAAAADYARSQASGSGTTVSQGRRGGWVARNSRGESVRIDAATARTLQANPGYSVLATNRNASNFSMFDANGELVERINVPTTANIVVTPFDPSMFSSTNWNSLLENAMLRHDFNQLNHHQTAGQAGFKRGGAWLPN